MDTLLTDYTEYWYVADKNHCVDIPVIKRSWYNLQITYDVVSKEYNLINWMTGEVLFDNLDCDRNDDLPLMLVALREYIQSGCTSETCWDYDGDYHPCYG